MNYARENLLLVVEDVKEGHLTASAACKKYDIPRANHTSKSKK